MHRGHMPARNALMPFQHDPQPPAIHIHLFGFGFSLLYGNSKLRFFLMYPAVRRPDSGAMSISKDTTPLSRVLSLALTFSRFHCLSRAFSRSPLQLLAFARYRSTRRTFYIHLCPFVTTMLADMSTHSQKLLYSLLYFIYSTLSDSAGYLIIRCLQSPLFLC